MIAHIARPALSKGAPAGARQVRALHITGPATYASPVLGSSRKALSRTRLHEPSPSSPLSKYNTSRSFKTVGDSSTVDFAFLPDLSFAHRAEFQSANAELLRTVPRVPQFSVLHPIATPTTAATEVLTETIRPQIYSVQSDASHISSNSAVSAVLASSQLDDLDFGSSQQLKGSVSESAAAIVNAVHQTAGSVWNDFLDDVFGPKRVAV